MPELESVEGIIGWGWTVILREKDFEEDNYRLRRRLSELDKDDLLIQVVKSRGTGVNLGILNYPGEKDKLCQPVPFPDGERPGIVGPPGIFVIPHGKDFGLYREGLITLYSPEEANAYVRGNGIEFRTSKKSKRYHCLQDCLAMPNQTAEAEHLTLEYGIYPVQYAHISDELLRKTIERAEQEER